MRGEGWLATPGFGGHRIMKTTHISALLLGLLLAACGGSGAGGKDSAVPKADRSGIASATGDAVSKEAASEYQAALNAFIGHDKKFDWNEAACKGVAEKFLGASKQQTSDGGNPAADKASAKPERKATTQGWRMAKLVPP